MTSRSRRMSRFRSGSTNSTTPKSRTTARKNSASSASSASATAPETGIYVFADTDDRGKGNRPCYHFHVTGSGIYHPLKDVLKEAVCDAIPSGTSESEWIKSKVEMLTAGQWTDKWPRSTTARTAADFKGRLIEIVSDETRWKDLTGKWPYEQHNSSMGEPKCALGQRATEATEAPDPSVLGEP